MAINQIPFDAKRMFFISDVPQDAIRGEHFSKSSTFLYIIIQGNCKVELDNGSVNEKYELDTNVGLLFPSNTWMKIYDFAPNTILCVLADFEYRIDDYVSNYEELKRIVERRKCIT